MERTETRRRIYPLHADAALVVDRVAAAWIILRHDMEAGRVPAQVRQLVEKRGFALMADMGRLPTDYLDQGLAAMVLRSWGTECERYPDCFAAMCPAFPELAGHGKTRTLDPGELLVVRPDRNFSAFAPAYAGPDELLSEFRRKTHDALPADGDYWLRVMRVFGQYVDRTTEIDRMLEFLKI